MIQNAEPTVGTSWWAPYNQDLSVIIQAYTEPNNLATWNLVAWVGGQAVPDFPNRRAVPRAHLQNALVVSATLGEVTLQVDITVRPRLLRILVQNAQNTQNDDWQATYAVPGDVVLQALTAPDTPAAWAQLVWGGAGLVAVAGQANRQTVTRGALRALAAATVAIGPQQQQVRIEVVPGLTNLQLIESAVNTGGDNWKSWVNNANAVVAEATVIPANPAAQQQVRWNLGAPIAAVPGQPHHCQISRTAERTAPVAVTATVGTQQRTVNLVIHRLPVLRLRNVTFAGNHAIDQDTLGPFVAPEWQRSRILANTSHPLCYTRNTPIQLNAQFDVTTRPRENENVTVQGKVTLGGVDLTFTANVAVAANAGQVGTGVIASDNPLANVVACHDAAQILWTAVPQAGAGWTQANAAGASTNPIYVTLGNPVAGLTLYWTLLDVSCRAGAGDNGAANLVAHAFGPFQARDVRRKRDGRQICYWVPGDTDAMNTQGLLARGDAGGQCGALAELFVDICKAHGIATAHKVYVGHRTKLLDLGVIAGGAPPEVYGFLVKNWQFDHPPASNGNAFTHTRNGDCHTRPPNGIPGQGNPNPPPQFVNHFVVRYTPNETLYDPSYGVSFGGGAAAAQRAWEGAGIAGLFRGALPSAGYDTALRGPGDPVLLRYIDLVANALF